MIVRSALAIAATIYGVSFASPVLAGGTTVGGNPDGQGTVLPFAPTSVTPAAILSAISALTGGTGGATPEVIAAANVLANALNTGAPAAEVDAALTGLIGVVFVGGVPEITPEPGQTPQQAFVQIQAAITQLAAILGLPLTAPSIQALIALAQQALGV